MIHEHPHLLTRLMTTIDTADVLDMTLRLAKIDGDGVNAFEEHRRILRDQADPDVYLTVAVGDRGDRVGMIRLQINEKAEGAVSHFFVRPGAPRKTAERLMQQIVHNARQRGLVSLYLTCTVDNPAHKTYSTIGFKQISTTYKASIEAIYSNMEGREKWAM